MTDTTFNEALHPRDGKARFTTKPNSHPENTLDRHIPEGWTTGTEWPNSLHTIENPGGTAEYRFDRDGADIVITMTALDEWDDKNPEYTARYKQGRTGLTEGLITPFGHADAFNRQGDDKHIISAVAVELLRDEKQNAIDTMLGGTVDDITGRQFETLLKLNTEFPNKPNVDVHNDDLIWVIYNDEDGGATRIAVEGNGSVESVGTGFDWEDDNWEDGLYEKYSPAGDEN